MKFKADYVGKPFIATGSFKQVNRDLFKYHFTVNTRYGPVSCETKNDDVEQKLKAMEAGQEATITGIIDDTWMGDLVLRQCDIK